MREFILVRDIDVTGVSGIGVVAEGVVFQDGQAILKWLRAPYSLGVYHSLETLVDVHGHEGNTRVEFVKSKELIKDL
jgi:hypothetical protein